MTKQGKQELLKAVRPRYRKASNSEKSQILGEFMAATGYNRNFAIQLIRTEPASTVAEKEWSPPDL